MQDLNNNVTGTAGAAARAMLLFLAVFGFAVMWDSDHRPDNENWLAERGRHRAHSIATRRDRVRAREVTTSQTIGEFDHTRPASLPEGIVAGRYRVVDSSGDVQTVQVTGAMVNRSAVREAARDMYVMGIGREARYFIRITPPEVASSVD